MPLKGNVKAAHSTRVALKAVPVVAGTSYCPRFVSLKKVNVNCSSGKRRLSAARINSRILLNLAITSCELISQIAAVGSIVKVIVFAFS